jgi:hypothetical protein
MGGELRAFQGEFVTLGGPPKPMPGHDWHGPWVEDTPPGQFRAVKDHGLVEASQLPMGEGGCQGKVMDGQSGGLILLQAGW